MAKLTHARGVHYQKDHHFDDDSDSDSEASQSRRPPAQRPNQQGLSQSNPTLPSLAPQLAAQQGAAVPASVTFTMGNREAQTRLQEHRSGSLFERTIEASLSMHDISIYGRMIASSDALRGGREALLPETLPEEPSPRSLRSGPLGEETPRAVGAARPIGAAVYAPVFFSVVKSYVGLPPGPAILYLPHGFHDGGMLFSAALLPFLGALVACTFYHLTLCHIAAAGAPSYGDMAGVAFGWWGRFLVQSSLAAAQLCTCTSYYMFVASNLRDTAARFDATLPPDRLLIPLLVPLFLPLTLLPRLRQLAPTNILADFLILGGLSFVAIYAVAQLSIDDGTPSEPIVWVQPPGSFFLFLGTACFTFEGSGLMVPMVASLEAQHKPHFPRIFVHAMALVTLLFTGFGALGYACFGGDVVMPVTLNVHVTPGYSAALRVGYSLAVVCTYPLQLMPIADMLETALAAPPFHLVQPSLGRRLLARGALMALTCSVAAACAAYFDHFVSLVGVLCGIPLSFIQPAAIYLRLCDRLGVGSFVGRAGARVAVAVGSLGMVCGAVGVLAAWKAPDSA